MRSFTYDANLQLKDSSAAITSSAAAQVSSAAQILDVGAALFKGVAVIDITAIDIASTNESYRLTVQGSNSSSFASGIENLATLDLGATASRLGSGQDSVVGRYELLFQNEQASTVYRYLRLYMTLAGTTPSITLTAFVGRDYLPS